MFHEREKMPSVVKRTGFITLLAVGILYLPPLPTAFVTPFGPVYIRSKTEETIAHEQCHMDRMDEIGAVAFYWDYLTGGACAEETRCGIPDHDVCAYPWGGTP